MSGVSCYFGVTTSGKTTLALKHLVDQVQRDGRPALVLDCMPARNLKDYVHATTVEMVLELLYARGLHAFYTPKNEEELDRLLGAVHAAGIAGGPVNVLWDEASLHQSPNHIGENMARALRGWQHSDCGFRIVTQRPADLNGVVFATMPEVFCFRLERQADLKRVQDELSLDPATISKLNQGQFVLYSRDRFATLKGEPDAADAPRDREDQARHADALHAGEVQQPPPGLPGSLPQNLGEGGRLPSEAPGRNEK